MFFLTCREMGGGYRDESETTCFRTVGQVSPPSVSVYDIQFLNAHGRLSQMQFSTEKDRVHIVTELRGKTLPTHLFLQHAIESLHKAHRWSGPRVMPLLFTPGSPSCR